MPTVIILVGFGFYRLVNRAPEDVFLLPNTGLSKQI